VIATVDLLAERSAAAAERPAAPAAAGVEPDAADHQLVEAETALQELLTRYKDTHPDVAAARRRLRELQSKAAATQQLATNRPADSPAPVTAAARAQQARARQLQNEIDSVDRQLATRQLEEVRLRGQMSDLQRRLDASPTRETELVALTRDYQTINQMYVNLLSRIEDAKLSAKVENGQVGQQFKVIDPARVPGSPYFPDVPLLAAAGALAGLGLAVMFVAFTEYRDATLKTEEDVLSVLGLPVLALIPVMSQPLTLPASSRMRKLLLPWRGAAAILLAAAAAGRFLVASVTSIG
jgi:uncharacterized protein involved in exopolysaccharide biosynthesis